MPMTKSLKHYRLSQKLGVEDWIHVVEDYSTRRLTVSSDRFIALSGIAHRFQQDLQLQYIAGLWHSERDQVVLLRMLLWIAGVENAEHEANWMSSARYNGPSWSWATSKCPIVYSSLPVLLVPGCRKEDFRQWHAKIHSTYAANNDLNPFAYVKDARLTISAPLKQIKGLCRNPHNNYYYIFDPQNGPEAKIGTVSLDAKDSIPSIYDENNKLKDQVEHGKDGAILPSCLHIVDISNDLVIAIRLGQDDRKLRLVVTRVFLRDPGHVDFGRIRAVQRRAIRGFMKRTGTSEIACPLNARGPVVQVHDYPAFSGERREKS
ncbi:hypothetical protein BDW67DRAFT_188899 [Aspergillus spinulosporus]